MSRGSHLRAVPPAQAPSRSSRKAERAKKTGTEGEGSRPGGDFGYSTRPRGPETSDRDEREAYPGSKLRSAYLSIVGENPDLLPGDTQGAAEVLARIEAAIAKGGWTRSEWRRLHSMRWKWKHRADGTDPRFMVVGNRQTGLTTEQRNLIEVQRIVRAISVDLDGNSID